LLARICNPCQQKFSTIYTARIANPRQQKIHPAEFSTIYTARIANPRQRYFSLFLLF
jgi:hypothetical protein